MLQVFEVTYFDENTGRTGAKFIKAYSEDAAVSKVEQMGAFEVIEVEFVDFAE